MRVITPRSGGCIYNPSSRGNNERNSIKYIAIGRDKSKEYPVRFSGFTYCFMLNQMKGCPLYSFSPIAAESVHLTSIQEKSFILRDHSWQGYKYQRNS
eukprot:scaffold11624_cov277-Chaetoceros_neogracile.AAC.2